MTINTTQKYRDDIKAIAEKITVDYNTYCRTIPLLESAGVVIPSYSNSLAEAIQQGINAYVRSVCKQVSNAYQGETTRIFTMADLRFTGSELPPLFSPYSSNTNKEHSDEFVLTKILNHFDFDKFDKFANIYDVYHNSHRETNKHNQLTVDNINNNVINEEN